MAIEDYYTTGEVWRGTEAPDSAGNVSATLAKHHEIEAAINQASTSDVQEANAWNANATHKMYCAVTEDVLPADEIYDASGNIYRVVGILKDTMGRGHHYKILLEWKGVDNG